MTTLDNDVVTLTIRTTDKGTVDAQLSVEGELDPENLTPAQQVAEFILNAMSQHGAVVEDIDGEEMHGLMEDKADEG